MRRACDEGVIRRCSPPGRVSLSSIVMRPHATGRLRLLIDILQGAGLAGAAGIRPFLPALVAGALATADVGIDYEGTPFAFLEAPGWLLAVVLALIAAVVAQRRGVPERVLDSSLAGIGIGLGALLCAGTLADHGYVWWPGLIGGALCAALAGAATQSLVVRTRARLDAEARAALPVYLEGAAVAARRRWPSSPRRSRAVALGFFALPAARRRAAARARSTRACASCGEPAPEARPDRHRRHEADDARARDQGAAPRRR